MPDQHTYFIQLRGAVDVNELNALAPLQMTRVQVGATTMQVTVSADQAGLIGLLRHLHGLGFQLLSVRCESTHQEKGHVASDTDASG